MTPDIVDQYFLNIGASFRSSDQWRKNHEVDGHSTIHRTGRFGIGLLAAFLLGKEVRVTTRHISQSDSDGVTFLCKQGADSIELRPCSFHAGTKIEVTLTQQVAKALTSHTDTWDWFCLSRPKVTRVVIDKSERSIKQSILVPECKSDLNSTEWHRITVEGYDDVMWSYEAKLLPRYFGRPLICNGIFVTVAQHRLQPNISPGLNVLRASAPALVVFDPDGRFPLNLQRDQIVGDAESIRHALANDISRFFCEKIIQAFPKIRPGINSESIAFSVESRVPGLLEEDSRPRTAGMIITADGLLPVDLDLLAESQLPFVLIDAINLDANRGSFMSPQVSSAGIPYLGIDGITQSKSSRTDFLRNSLGIPDHLTGKPTGFFAPVKITGRRLFIRKSDVTELVSPGNVPKTHWNNLRKEFDGKEYALWEIGQVTDHKLDLTLIDQSLSKSGSLGFTIIYFDWSKDSKDIDKPPTPFSTAWRKIVGGFELKYRTLKSTGDVQPALPD